MNSDFNLFQNFILNLKFVLEELDPSLFQSVILGILAIFVLFAIVFLTDILNKDKKSKFEKVVLTEEVLGVKKFVLTSILGLFIF
jgi:hypothetical protein